LRSRPARYAIGAGADTAMVDLICRPNVPRGQIAAGSVHHVAWRVADAAGLERWRSELERQGADVTSVRDRQYFRSIYFREPGAVLFEIATDPPGFAIDEAPAELGTHLMLRPGWSRSESRSNAVCQRSAFPALQRQITV
jgi:glyoxalase family protein